MAHGPKMITHSSKNLKSTVKQKSVLLNILKLNALNE